MLFYSVPETAALLLAAIILDLLIGDPRVPTHPVIYIGRLVSWLEQKLYPRQSVSPFSVRVRGTVLCAVVTLAAFAALLLLCEGGTRIHPWIGYALHVWFISSTVAVKGLKDAATLVYRELAAGSLTSARRFTGYIVGRDTHELDESELSRATVETVAENTVDAVVSPLVFAFFGGAPLAMLYRAANTLDSMVGYRNARYLHFGSASARFDDVLNFLPARLTGLLLVCSSFLLPGLSGGRAMASIMNFARLHPSPNSGIPEAAAAGALGIRLGGTNRYGGAVSVRAGMGWPLRPLDPRDIPRTIRLLYGVTALWIGGLLCVLFAYI